MARAALIRLVVTVLAAGLVVATWQTQHTVVTRADLNNHGSQWTPTYPDPTPLVEPRPGAWCGNRCRNGHVR